LAVAYGRLEYVQDTLKRINKSKLILTQGRELDDINIILKALGLLGDYTLDRFHRMKQVVGQFCDGDFRRIYEIDATGMNAANFATFSQLGGMGSIRTYKYLHDYPKEFYRVQEQLMAQLPAHKANEKEDKPCHVTDVKFAMTAGMTLEGLIPNLSKLGAFDGEYKHRLYHKTHPLDKFLEEAVQSWNDYQKKWQSEGFDHQYIPYPYTREMVHQFFENYSKQVTMQYGLWVSPDGPQSVSYPETGTLERTKEGSALGTAPQWVEEGTLDKAMADQSWWKGESSSLSAFQLINEQEAKKDAPAYVPHEGHEWAKHPLSQMMRRGLPMEGKMAMAA